MEGGAERPTPTFLLSAIQLCYRTGVHTLGETHVPTILKHTNMHTSVFPINLMYRFHMKQKILILKFFPISTFFLQFFKKYAVKLQLENLEASILTSTRLHLRFLSKRRWIHCILNVLALFVLLICIFCSRQNGAQFES